jgi:ABC-type nitrate/sulfonate/bicarbonate transport system ATPase subunit
MFTVNVTDAATTIPATTTLLEARHIRQEYRDTRGQSVTALFDVSLAAYPREFIAIIGPSGSGKSTLLNVLAGIDAPVQGEVWLNGAPCKPRQLIGQIGLMPQRDLLLPWRTSLGNAIAGLRVRGVADKVARKQALALFERFGLANFAGAYPYALSGGMRQRVALVRSALASGPVLLLDEPFGALDALTRGEMHQWLLDIWQDLGKTIIQVTHDVNEALILADRVIVISARPGRVVADLPITLPRPRDSHVQASVEFGKLRQELLTRLEARE